MIKTSVLFLCTGNSRRTQMAEGFLRALGGDSFDVVSAGSEETPLDPRPSRSCGRWVSIYQVRRRRR